MVYTKLVSSGSMHEVYQFEKEPINKGRSLSSYAAILDLQPIEKPMQSQDQLRIRRERKEYTSRRPDSVKRARKNLTRLIYANLYKSQPPFILTLTIYEVTTVSIAWKRYRDYLALLRRHYGHDFRVVSVLEFQERGAVHFHSLYFDFPLKEIGCIGRYVKSLYGRKKTRFIHECPPGRQCERRTRHMQRMWLWGFSDSLVTDGSPKLAGYLAKYLQKAMLDERLRGEKAYSATRNALRPMHYASSTLHIFLPQLIPTGDPCVDLTFDTKWLGKGRYKQYLETDTHANNKTQSNEYHST